MAYHFAHPDFLPRRALAVSAIIVLHVLVAYLLATGLIHTIEVGDSAPTPARVNIERAPPTPAPVVRAKAELAAPKIDSPPLPPPPVMLTPESPPDTGTLVGGESPAGELAGPPAAEAILIQGKNVLPATVDYYPPAKRREGIEGASYVRVCVDAQGIRQGEPLLERSSGDAELDTGALNIARHGRYARSLRGVLPVPNCYHFRIAFKIQ
jgi:protein TonB